MGTSKNSKKGSKPAVVIRPAKEKKHKEFILVELTDEIKREIREDLSSYHGRQVLDIKRKFGKDYMVLLNN